MTISPTIVSSPMVRDPLECRQAQTRRRVEINLHDTSIGIWQDDARDPTFQREVYGGIIRHLRDSGWTIGHDPHIKQHYTILSPQHRLGRRGDLRCSIEVGGRACQMNVWAETWPIDNPNGRRHDFSKLPRFGYLDRQRFLLLRRKVIAWARELFDVTELIDRSAERTWPRFPFVTAFDAVLERRSERTFGDGFERLTDRERTTKDGHHLAIGDAVFLTDRKGRVMRGRAHFAGGNTWLVVTGKWTIERAGAWELWRTPPVNPRAKHNQRLRRQRLEGELSSAIARMDFARAATLRRILFGDAPLFRIRKKGGAYYAANWSGYSNDLIRAGLYLRFEAEAEVSSRRGQLVLCTVDGEEVPA